MYFDETLLKIIMGINDDDNVAFEKAFDLYQEAITKIAEKVMDIYMKDPSIKKPAIKGLMNLVYNKIDDPNLTEDKKVDIYLDAITAASSTPEYMELSRLALEAFHTDLIHQRMEEMEENQKNEFRDHLRKVRETVLFNANLINQIAAEAEKKD